MVRRQLALMSDQRLTDLGFDDDAIAAIRTGAPRSLTAMELRNRKMDSGRWAVK